MYNELESIDDPISDSYLPYSQNVFKGIKTPEDINNEYIVINIYKSVLNRNPTKSEIDKYADELKEKNIDETILKVNLLNSTEYKRNVKLQSNDVSSYIEYTVAKEDLMTYITKLYFLELNLEPPKIMLLPLRDVYTYLQSNEYLFRAFLISDNYPKFEKEVLNTKLLTKINLANLFNKYFILYELKLKANDIKRAEILARQNKENKTPIALETNLKNTPMTNLDDIKIDQRDLTELIKNIISNSANIFKK
jgi:hypothetical protein